MHSGSEVSPEILVWLVRSCMAQINTGSRSIVTPSALYQKRLCMAVKPLLGGKLSMTDYNAQVGETHTMIEELNKLTELGMPKTCRIY